MERDIADELIDFFANADDKNDTLALALLEPFKNQRLKPVKSEATTQTEIVTAEQLTPNEPPPNTQVKKNKDKTDSASDPVNLIIEEFSSLGLKPELLLELEKSLDNIRKNIKVKDIEALDSKSTGDKDFLRDHNLLPKLIVHPQTTLTKILKVYPNLPLPENINKSLKVKTLLGEWLPCLSKYSREYLIHPEIRELTLNIIKLIVKPNPKKKRKSTKDADTVQPLEKK